MAEPKPIRHGTHAGYQLHRRRGQDPCVACKSAQSRYGQRMRTTDPEERKLAQMSARREAAAAQIREINKRDASGVSHG